MTKSCFLSFLCLLGMLILLATIGIAEGGDVFSVTERAYAAATAQLESGDYEAARESFLALGDYEDSVQYTSYAEAWLALEQEEFELAHALFSTLAAYGFQASDQLAWYSLARAYEQAGDKGRALSLYEDIEALDSTERAKTLRKEGATPSEIQETGLLVPAWALLDGSTILFNDRAVEGAIRRELGIPIDAITTADMARVVDFTFDPINDPLTEGEVYDISVLQFCRNLRTVNIAWQPLASLEALRGLGSLQGVALTACYNISDVTPLANKLFLSSVWLNGLDAPDVSSVLTSPNLQQFLALNGAGVQTIAPLAKGHSLQSFTCDSALEDYTPLLGHTGLVAIDLVGVDSKTLGTFMRTLPALKSVSIQNSCLERDDLLTLLHHELRVLNLEYCTGVDLEVIGALRMLQTLRLKGCGLVDVSPLAALAETLLFLDIRENPVEDPSALSALTQLQMLGISPADGFTLRGLMGLLPGATILYGDANNYETIEPGASM